MSKQIHCSVDPDEMAHMSRIIWVYSVYPDLLSGLKCRNGSLLTTCFVQNSKLYIYICLALTALFCAKTYTCYRPTADAVILVNREFSLLNVFFYSNYREMNG